MIAIAIIGILMAISIPSYQNYTRRAHYTEIVAAAAPYKLGVEECYLTDGELTHCSAGQQGVPAGFINNSPNGAVASVAVAQGVITVVPKDHYGLTQTDTYILQPEIISDSIHWTKSGGGVTKGYAH